MYILIFVLCAALAACGGSDSGPTAAPSPTTTNITVTLDSPLKIAETKQAASTATLSNGTVQALTTGFQSDSPNVATTTSAGAVTGVGNGFATIYIVSGGRQGQMSLRVLPDYQGQWSVRYVVRSCTASGVFVLSNICGSLGVGNTGPATFILTQSGETVTGSFFMGTISFPNTTGPVSAGGAVTFTSRTTSDIPISVTWTLNAGAPGQLTGTVTQLWSSNTTSGSATIIGEIISSNKSASVPMSAQPRSVTEAIRAVQN